MRYLLPPWPAEVSALPTMALTSQGQRTAGTHFPPVGRTSIYLDDPNAAVRILRETRSKPMGQNLTILTPGVLRQLVRTTPRPPDKPARTPSAAGIHMEQRNKTRNQHHHQPTAAARTRLRPLYRHPPCSDPLPGLIKLCGAGLKAT